MKTVMSSLAILFIAFQVGAQPTPPADKADKADSAVMTVDQALAQEAPSPAARIQTLDKIFVGYQAGEIKLESKDQGHLAEARQTACLADSITCLDISSWVKPLCASSPLDPFQKNMLRTAISVTTAANGKKLFAALKSCPAGSLGRFEILEAIFNRAIERNLFPVVVEAVKEMKIFLKPEAQQIFERTLECYTTATTFFQKAVPYNSKLGLTINMWAAAASQQAGPQWVPGVGWRRWFLDSQRAFRLAARQSFVPALTQKVFAGPGPQDPVWNEKARLVVCRYLRRVGKNKECGTLLATLRKNSPKDVMLTLEQSYLDLSSGDYSAALKRLKAIAPLLPSELKPWVNMSYAVIYLNTGHPTEAKQQLDAHLAGLTGARSNLMVKYTGRLFMVEYLFMTKDFAKAKQQAEALEKEIAKDVVGSNTLKYWVERLLLMSAVHDKSLAAVKSRAAQTRATLAGLPDLQVDLNYIKALEAAAEGTYTPAMLEPLRQAYGSKEPTFMRVEIFLAAYKK